MSQLHALTIFRDGPAGREVFLTLTPEGQATGYNGHVDLGTGIGIALTQIVAEELDLPLGAVSIHLGDTAHTPNQGPTIASETIQVAAKPLRLAAAQARAWLITRAAERLDAPVEDMRTEDGACLWQGTSLPYASLLENRAEALPLDPATPVKDPATYRIVGRKAGRIDLPAKLTAEFDYIQDVRVEGMIHGHVIRPPYAGRDSGDFIGRSLIRCDESSVAGMPGYLGLHREGDFLAVLAETAPQARAIAEALKVDWRLPPPLPRMTTIAQTLKEQPSTPRLLLESGDIDRGLADTAHRLDRTYVWPWHLHGSIGPSCAVADWNGGAPVVWSGTQNPHMLRTDLAQLVDLPEDRIEIRRHQAAGCYGRNCADDVAGDALLLARACGRPVRVQLTRAQETLWEPKGAAQLMEIRGGLDAAKDFHSYEFQSWYPSNRGPNLALLLTGRISPDPRPDTMGDRTAVPPYRIPHRRITAHDMAPIVRASWLRGVSALPNTFAHESYVDELAAEAGEDPVAFRLRHMDDPRQAALVRETAEKGGWTDRAGPRLRREGRMAYGQGFAFATYVHGPFPGVAAASAAWVVDVAVDTETGEVTLNRVFVGQDQGLVINPDGVRQQIHGNVIQTAGRVLSEEVSFDEIRVTDRSFADYPITTFPQLPEITTMIIARPEDPPLGVGESAAVPAAAAIANAIFDATGVRMREAPFTPDRLRAALGRPDTASPAALPPAAARRRPALRNRLLAGAVGVMGLAGLGAVSLPLARALPPVTPALTASAEQLARGRDLFALGNCSSCHTAPGGLPNTGGKPVETPFGTVYSTNLTPDPETGLGRWSYEAFARAMRKGISRDGHNLFPAFPYTSFAGMQEGDLQDLYAYVQSLEPVRAETPVAQMQVPRPAMAAWNALYHSPRPLTADPAQDATWNRGRYLVETVGHCSACHTPRTAAGAEDGRQPLAGAMIRDWFAPALAGAEAGARGWTVEALADYLQTGTAPGFATASGPMAEVIEGTSNLPRGDVLAMATYLASLAEGTPAPMPEQARPQPDRIHRIYESACASCHEPAFADLLTAAQVPLGRAPALRAPRPETAETVIRQGLRAPYGTELRDMPGFAAELPEQDIAALARYLRARYAPDLPAWE